MEKSEKKIKVKVNQVSNSVAMIYENDKAVGVVTKYTEIGIGGFVEWWSFEFDRARHRGYGSRCLSASTLDGITTQYQNYVDMVNYV